MGDSTIEPLAAGWPAWVLPTPGQRWSMSVSTTSSQKALGPEVQIQLQTANPYPHSIFIRALTVWNGISLESKVDMWTRVWACGGIYDPPQIIWSHNWDRYQMTNWHDLFRQDFGDGYVEIVEGGWLTFNAQCTMVGPQPHNLGYHAQYDVQFMVWFEAVRPGTPRV
jgi:hypothetical protein